ncbi:MAG: ketoacyl-ACP synthase III [Oscillospiraceae bacterium]|jgi:3-oxoacyl-[acyl-carrier-protein] synthase-3|nr:ketoacyl-ACP synthase III [Oscillospiraceae bacterium]
MNPNNKRGIKITGTGSYLPPLTVTNDDLAEILDTNDEWIYTRTGIKARRYNGGKPNYTMAVEAAKRALENAGAAAAEIDYILLSTSTPDFIYPITACLVQNALCADNAACLDINAACTGFVAGLDVARGLLYSGYNRILFVASECLTLHADFADRATCVLFGDSAGAVVLEKADKFFVSCMKAKGVSADEPVLYYKQNYEINAPFCEQKTKSYAQKLQMDGKEVYKFAVDAMPEAVKTACGEAGLTIDDIDLLIPHQANIRIVQTAAKSLGVSMNKVYVNIENNGNTSSACMPVCLDELNKAGKLREGMKICFAGFGAGLTYGAVIIEI